MLSRSSFCSLIDSNSNYTNNNRGSTTRSVFCQCTDASCGNGECDNDDNDFNDDDDDDNGQSNDESKIYSDDNDYDNGHLRVIEKEWQYLLKAKSVWARQRGCNGHHIRTFVYLLLIILVTGFPYQASYAASKHALQVCQLVK